MAHYFIRVPWLTSIMGDGNIQTVNGMRHVALKAMRCVGGKTRYKPQRSARDEEMLREHLDRCAEEFPKWMKAHHKHVVPVLDVKIDFEPIVISPFYSTNLAQHLAKHPEVDRLLIAVQIASGLRYLHNLDPTVVHGGLGLGAIMMNENGDAMVSNFGMPPICDQIAHDVLLTTTGVVTTYMSAPELLFATDEEPFGPRGPEHSPATDSWDFGSLLLEIFSGKMPFEGVAQGRAILWISAGRKPDPKDHPNLPADDVKWNIIMSCFSMVPSDRPTMLALEILLEKLRSALGQDVRASRGSVFEALYTLARL